VGKGKIADCNPDDSVQWTTKGMGCVSSVPVRGESEGSKPTPTPTKRRSVTHARESAWKTTGIVALRDSSLRELPKKLFEEGGEFALALRNVDASNNRVREIPREIGNCVNVTRLVMTKNVLEGLPVQIGQLTRLKTLIIDDNRLVEIPESVGSMAALATLSVRGNALKTLPSSLARCASLKTVRVSRNPTLGSEALDALAFCHGLEEIDASACAITIVPAALGALKKLKILNVDDNVGVETIPSEIFKSCAALTKLTAHGTSIRNIEYVDGYDDYVARVRQRHGKIISGNSMIVDDERGLDLGFDHTRD